MSTTRHLWHSGNHKPDDEPPPWPTFRECFEPVVMFAVVLGLLCAAGAVIGLLCRE